MMNQLTLFDPIEIQLTQGYCALVDPADSDLRAAKWSANVHRRKDGTIERVYAWRKKPGAPRGHFQYLHQVVLERVLGRSLCTGEFSDHIDGNGLNNKRSNIRLASPAQNVQNQRRRCDSSSGYKGVTWHAQSGKWRAKIQVSGKTYHLGLFDSPEDAHAAYVEAAKAHFGEFMKGA